MQLTGIRVPDPQITKFRTGDDIVQCLLVPEKPPKLATVLQGSKVGDLPTLPNVQLLDRRWKAADKETEIGREKLIRAELARRNLPYDMREVRVVQKW